MKRMLLMAMLGMGMLTACEHIEMEDVPVAEDGKHEATKKFTFTIKGDFENPEFRDGQTRANSYMKADGAEMTDLWVIDYCDGQIKQEKHQVSTDEDWGKPTMSLSLGEHHVLFLASRGAEPTYQSGKVTWAKPLDTFYTDYEVTVVKTSNGNRAVTLDRVATKLVMTMDDAIPVGTNTLTLSPESWYTGWDMVTGEPIDTDSYTQTFSIPSSWGGRTGGSFTSWSLSTKGEWTTALRYESYAGSEKNGAILITDAPFKASRTTAYHGKFYTNATESNVSLNSAWLPQYEGEY